MRYEIRVGPDYLKADLFNRETTEETREFLAALAAEARKHRRCQILIGVHTSRSLFKVGEYGLLAYFKELEGVSEHRIALTGDSDELRLSHQYIESLARQHGINVRGFRHEQAALNWLRERRRLPDRRQRQEPYGGLERRHHQDRRNPEGVQAV
jgi:hypothetical protein